MATTTSSAAPVTLAVHDAEQILSQLTDALREFLDQFEDPTPLPPDEAEAFWRHTHAVTALTAAIVAAHYADRRGCAGQQSAPREERE